MGAAPEIQYELKPVQILLVEDNPADVELIREAFNEGKIINNLMVARDGEEALDALFSKSGSTRSFIPDLILLDLNLPKTDGRELLDQIRHDAKLKNTPVVILTASDLDKDVVLGSMMGASCYIVKPVDLEKILYVIKTIDSFSLQIVSPG